MITRDDLQLRILSCMSMEGSGIVKYRDDVNKISAVTITPRKSGSRSNICKSYKKEK